MFFLILAYLSQSIALNVYQIPNCADQQSKLRFPKLDISGSDCGIQNLLIENFNNFSSIKLYCVNTTNCDYYELNLKFVPDHPIVLSNELSFKSIKTNDLFWKYFLRFIFFNVKKVDKNLAIFDNFTIQPEIQIIFSLIMLDFGDCTLSESSKFTLFRNTYSVVFEKVRYKSLICPLIFYNKSISLLTFDSISETLVFNNQVRFIDLNYSIVLKIEQLFLKGHLISLSDNFFNLKMFSNLNFLIIFGKIKFIDWSVIFEMNNLRTFSIYSNDFHNFIYNNYKWFELIDQYRTEKITFWFSNLDNYSFPNEDFCVFYKFPELKKVKFEITLSSAFCNCVLYWISNKQCLNYLQQNCNFELWSNNCQNFTTRTAIIGKDFTIWNKLDYLITGALLNIVTLFGNLIFGSIALITNTITIFVCFRCKKFLSKTKCNTISIEIYNLIIFCSLVNVFYCIIQLLHFLNACPIINGTFCLNINQNIFIQYYEIYFVDFIGGILKSLSNILNICISVARCLTICENTMLFRIYMLYKKLTKNNFKFIFFLVLILILIMTNVDKINSTIVLNAAESLNLDYYGVPMRNWLIIEDVKVSNENFGYQDTYIKKIIFFFYLY